MQKCTSGVIFADWTMPAHPSSHPMFLHNGDGGEYAGEDAGQSFRFCLTGIAHSGNRLSGEIRTGSGRERSSFGPL
jgi:hypothetical protein